MISKDGQKVICDGDECENFVMNHLWGKIKAEGWAFLTIGKSYCPEHVPEWWAQWKANR